jgi:hypothetical protein
MRRELDAEHRRRHEPPSVTSEVCLAPNVPARIGLDLPPTKGPRVRKWLDCAQGRLQIVSDSAPRLHARRAHYHYERVECARALDGGDPARG